MTLTDPSDGELQEAFAIHVAKWSFHTLPNSAYPTIKHWKNARGDGVSIHFEGRWLTSADAVLPWLEKWHDFNEQLRDVEIRRRVFKDWIVILMTRQDHGEDWKDAGEGTGELPRAAVIALLPAHGVRVVFTKPHA